LGERGECEHLVAGGLEVVVDAGELVVVDLGQQPVVLGVDGVGVGLFEHRVQPRLDRRPRVLGAHAHQVRGVVGPTALPRGARQGRADRLHQPLVGVGGDQGDAGQAAGEEVFEEREPAGVGFAGRA